MIFRTKNVIPPLLATVFLLVPHAPSYPGYCDNYNILWASEQGDWEHFRKCLDEGQKADIHCLKAALINGHLDLAEFILECGVDPNDRYGNITLLMDLAPHPDFRHLVDFLLRHGAETDLRDLYYGYTALHYAAQAGVLETVDLLVENGAALDIVADYFGAPLAYASVNGHLEIVRFLLAKGAEINVAAEKSCQTPLTAALDGGHEEIAELLIRRGADINVIRSHGHGTYHATALEIAQNASFEHLVNLMLRIGKTADKPPHENCRVSLPEDPQPVDPCDVLTMPLFLGGYRKTYDDWLAALQEAQPYMSFTYKEWQLMRALSWSSPSDDLYDHLDDPSQGHAWLWHDFFQRYGDYGAHLLERLLSVGAAVRYQGFALPWSNYEVDRDPPDNEAPFLAVENAEGLFQGAAEFLEDEGLTDEAWEKYDWIFTRRFNSLRDSGRSIHEIFTALYGTNGSDEVIDKALTPIQPSNIRQDVVRLQLREAIKNKGNEDYERLWADGWRIARRHQTFDWSIDDRNQIIYLDGNDYSEERLADLFEALDTVAEYFQPEEVLEAYIQNFSTEEDLLYLKLMTDGEVTFYPARRSITNWFLLDNSSNEPESDAIAIRGDLDAEAAARELHERLAEVHDRWSAKLARGISEAAMGRVASMFMSDKERKAHDRRVAELSAAWGNAQLYIESEILMQCAGLAAGAAGIGIAKMAELAIRKAKKIGPLKRRLELAEEVLGFSPESDQAKAIMAAHKANSREQKEGILRALNPKTGEPLFTEAQVKNLMGNYVCGAGSPRPRGRKLITASDIPKELKGLRDVVRSGRISQADLRDLIRDFDRMLYRTRNIDKKKAPFRMEHGLSEQVKRLEPRVQKELIPHISKIVRAREKTNFFGNPFTKLDRYSLGFDATNKPMRDLVNSDEYVKRFREFFREHSYGTYGRRMEPDHIVPVPEITSIDGFSDLTVANQKKIIGYEKNLQALPGPLNSSKSDLTAGEWQDRAIRRHGEHLPPSYITWLADQQRTLRDQLENEINDLLRKQRTKRPPSRASRTPLDLSGLEALFPRPLAAADSGDFGLARSACLAGGQTWPGRARIHG